MKKLLFILIIIPLLSYGQRSNPINNYPRAPYIDGNSFFLGWEDTADIYGWHTRGFNYGTLVGQLAIDLHPYFDDSVKLADSMKEARHLIDSVAALGGGGGTPGGSTGSIQYNTGSAFGGNTYFKYITGGSDIFNVGWGGNYGLQIDQSGADYAMGDINASNKSTLIAIQDNDRLIALVDSCTKITGSVPHSVVDIATDTVRVEYLAGTGARFVKADAAGNLFAFASTVVSSVTATAPITVTASTGNVGIGFDYSYLGTFTNDQGIIGGLTLYSVTATGFPSSGIAIFSDNTSKLRFITAGSKYFQYITSGITSSIFRSYTICDHDFTYDNLSASTTQSAGLTTDLSFATGYTVHLKAGTNGTAGSGTLASGTVTINTTAILSGDIVHVQLIGPSGTLGNLVVNNIVNATSFDVKSYITSAGVATFNALENSTFTWDIEDKQ